MFRALAGNSTCQHYYRFESFWSRHGHEGYFGDLGPTLTARYPPHYVWWWAQSCRVSSSFYFHFQVPSHAHAVADCLAINPMTSWCSYMNSDMINSWRDVRPGQRSTSSQQALLSVAKWHIRRGLPWAGSNKNKRWIESTWFVLSYRPMSQAC